nr:aldo-keto reductase AKR2E4-like [Maniola hyperantus]
MRRLSRFVVLLFGLNLAAATQAPCIELNDGNKMPIVALGTGRGTASENAPLNEVRQAVYWAIEAGYRHIDTAAIYFDETEVGQGIKDAIDNNLVTREQLFVTTKLWSDKHRQQQVVPALKDSLQKLGLDYVDLYLIHFPVAVKEDFSFDDVDYLETWRGMEEARALGLTRSIGVSNFNASQVDRIITNSRVWPAVNQVEVNPTLTQEALVTHCQELGVAVMAFSPFGFVVSRKRPDAPPPRADDPVLVQMANKYRKSVGQIVLRYLIDRGLIPIPKSVNKKRLAENIDLFDFSLTKEEIQLINRFNKNKRVIDFDEWKDYPYFPYGEY